MPQPQNSQTFSYAPATSEEEKLRNVLMGAILEFGAPHAFESGAMTRPLGNAQQMLATSDVRDLDYMMLQEEGQGYSIFAALRTVYTPQTPVEPVRFAVELFTVKGVAVIDVAVPSRFEMSNAAQERTYDEKIAAHVRVDLVSSAKKTKLEDVLNSFMANRSLAESFKPLLTIMHEQAQVKGTQPLTADHAKLLATFIASHFGDFSGKAPQPTTPSPGEIIPETPAEVSQSDHWIAKVARFAEQYRKPRS